MLQRFNDQLQVCNVIRNDAETNVKETTKIHKMALLVALITTKATKRGHFALVVITTNWLSG